MSVSWKNMVFADRTQFRGLIFGLKFNNNLSDLMGNGWAFFAENMGYSTGLWGTNCVYSPERTTSPSCIRSNSSLLSFVENNEDIPFTFSMWINWEASSTASICDLFSKHTRARSVSQAEYQCSIDNTTGILQFVRYSQNSRSNYTTTLSSISITKNEWHHLAITSNGSDIKIYVDGEDVTGSTVITGMYVGMQEGADRISFFNSSDPRLFINTQFFGKIESAYAWRSIEKTPTEILEIYENPNDIYQ